MLDFDRILADARTYLNTGTRFELLDNLQRDDLIAKFGEHLKNLQEALKETHHLDDAVLSKTDIQSFVDLLFRDGNKVSKINDIRETEQVSGQVVPQLVAYPPQPTQKIAGNPVQFLEYRIARSTMRAAFEKANTIMQELGDDVSGMQLLQLYGKRIRHKDLDDHMALDNYRAEINFHGFEYAKRLLAFAKHKRVSAEDFEPIREDAKKIYDLITETTNKFREPRNHPDEVLSRFYLDCNAIIAKYPPDKLGALLYAFDVLDERTKSDDPARGRFLEGKKGLLGVLHTIMNSDHIEQNFAVNIKTGGVKDLRDTDQEYLKICGLEKIKAQYLDIFRRLLVSDEIKPVAPAPDTPAGNTDPNAARLNSFENALLLAKYRAHELGDEYFLTDLMIPYVNAIIGVSEPTKLNQINEQYTKKLRIFTANYEIAPPTAQKIKEDGDKLFAEICNVIQLNGARSPKATEAEWALVNTYQKIKRHYAPGIPNEYGLSYDEKTSKNAINALRYYIDAKGENRDRGNNLDPTRATYTDKDWAKTRTSWKYGDAVLKEIYDMFESNRITTHLGINMETGLDTAAGKRVAAR